MKKIAAVIFDMDGVLADTEPLHRAAEIETYEQADITITEEELEKYAGVPDRTTYVEVLRTHGGDPARAPALFEHKYARAMPRVIREHGISAIDGSFDVVKTAAGHFPCAVASSSPHRFITLVLETLKVADLLPLRVSSDDIPLGRGKPQPDIFLLAAKKLGVAPEQCFVIEDSAAGVRAAKAAGMMCIGFRNPHSGTQDLSQADVVVERMADILPILQKGQGKGYNPPDALR